MKGLASVYRLLLFFTSFAVFFLCSCDQDVTLGGGETTSTDETADDDDDDWLSNTVEQEVKTEPRVADTDHDGYGDGLEFVVDTGEPLISTIKPGRLSRESILTASEILRNQTDSDGDGLGDNYEVSYGLDTAKADTDGDGFADAIELVADTDPLDQNDFPDRDTLDSSSTTSGDMPADGDRDGLSDNVESVLETNSTTRDTDTDGFADGVEYLIGSDPLDAASVPDFREP